MEKTNGKRLKVGLDLDGVLADFMGAYLKRFPPEDNSVIDQRCKTELKRDREFWETLPKLREPDFKPTLYCTKRVNPKTYTKRWLISNDFKSAPIYQLTDSSENKSDYIKGLVDVFIDDMPENVEELLTAGIPCLLMDSPYNQNYSKPSLRIYSLELQEITEAYERNFIR